MRRSSLLVSMTLAALLVMVPTGTAVSSETGATAAPPAARTATGTAGCGKAPTLNSGTHTINSGGQNRQYILRIPANYDNNRPHRLVFGFHWLNGTAQEVDSGGSDGYNWSYYGLRRLAESTGSPTIFVAPQGLNNGWANSGGQDVALFDAVRQQVEAALCVDETQRFSAGFSYGGAMTYALACTRASVLRAVAVYSGAQLSGCNGGTEPVAYMGLHGGRDNVLPISMGRQLRDTFVRNNGCAQQNPPEPQNGSLRHIVTAYSGCRDGYPVVWAAFDSGHTPGPVDGSTGQSWQTWTSAEVWKFFTQFESGTPTGAR